MIQIEAIHIQEFRGIRDLRLTLGSKSFVVHGPNGSGKSGVVDAIDFALTGNIARLAGAGTSGLSVLKHGPHVHRRDNPAAAKVSLTVRETTSGQQAVLTRSVKAANKLTLNPDVPQIRAAAERAQQHPELTLSRREIIKYIVAEPGKRAQEVQALLKLDRLEEVRRLLRTVQSKTSAEEARANSEVGAAEEGMLRHLDLTSLLTAGITSEINKRRTVLGLDPFETVTVDTDLRAGVAGNTAQATFDKHSALRDVRALVGWLADTAAVATAVDQLNEALGELADNPTILASLRQRDLVETGLQLVSDAVCPLCDKDWDDTDALRAHLTEKLARSDAASKLQVRIQAATRSVVQELRTVRELIRTVRPHAVSFGVAELPHRLQIWSDDLVAFETKLSTVEGAADRADRLAGDPLALPAKVSTELAELLAAVEAQPDQSATAEAKSFLTIAQERWTRVRLARADRRKAAAAHETAGVVYQNYCSAADEALITLYKTVEDKFSNYYCEINADDESAFKAELEPSAGKLDLSVDFYGIGMFPPGAYHSEGHQDGMGICLYLALVEQLLGDDFRFAVLDDVVMSVDSSHRRQFCKLLKDRFPNVQFIITTHDEIWAKQMESSGLVSKTAQARFHGWTVNDGPAFEQSSDLWDRIDSDLSKDDVHGAAHKLRRHLESIMKDLAGSIRGQVMYRPDARYELGELFDAVKSRHKNLLKKAASAADSWNDEAAKQRIQNLKEARSTALLAQEGENWAINALVHYNEWATMTKADFVPVVDACKQLLELFSCANPECGSWIYVVGQPGHEESLRCSCGTYNLNLRSR
ncbi:MAG: AAA family ATPase [Actinomycetota bacterium]|nr:AAA family ATPase [Actinomycetota bacterium]